MASAFDIAFDIVFGIEGGFGANPADAGNWTGGAVGAGELRGTKYGISAASYPTLDIASITLDQAKAIYRRDYWDKVSGDQLPPTLALLVFDSAVNSGPDRAIMWLQAAVGETQDGVIGPKTMAAVEAKRGHGELVQAELEARRIVFLAGLPTWRTFGLGWARRVTSLSYATAQMIGAER